MLAILHRLGKESGRTACCSKDEPLNVDYLDPVLVSAHQLPLHGKVSWQAGLCACKIVIKCLNGVHS